MPGHSDTVALRLEPHAIPAMRAAVDDSLAELTPFLARLASEGYIVEPWLADPESERSLAHYNDRVMDSPDGPYAALVAYEQELHRIRETLVQMEEAYRRTEGDNEMLWGRA